MYKDIKEIAKDLYEFAKKEGVFEKIRNNYKGRKNVLVLGSTGAGKTNFLKSLQNLNASPIDYMDRTPSAYAINLVIGEIAFSFVDTPGQKLHSDKRNKAIRELIQKGKIETLINVVSYGYHEYRITEDIPVSDSNEIDEDYLIKHRGIEIKALKEVEAILADNETVKNFVTLVSKADLWWNRKPEVFEHYESGEYFQGIGEFNKLSHNVIEFSSVLHKFYKKGNMSGSFDELDRLRTRMSFFRTLVELSGKQYKTN